MGIQRFSWLHFTDIHAGLDAEEWLWPGVEEEVLTDLERVHRRAGPFDAVFFTGDLTQSGARKEFEIFDARWGAIKSKLAELGSAPALIAVPGNHDLVRPTPDTSLCNDLRRWNHDADLRTRFWRDDTSEPREAIRSAFRNWTDWASHGITWGQFENVARSPVLPGDFAGTLQRRNLRIGILGLNTAALQIGAGDYRGRLSLHPRQAVVLVGKPYEWANEHDACFVLTHHDSSWLDPLAQEAWRGEIAKPGRFAVHFCGHHHEQRQTTLIEGGSLPRVTIVGRSLFGIETYSNQGKRVERLHGYSSGHIEFGRTRTIRRWPRRDEPQQAGHRVVGPDLSEDLENDEGTRSLDIGPSPCVSRSRADLNAQTTTSPFAAIIREKTRDFVGRSWLAKIVDDFLERNDRGYIRIHALPGMGKTAFAARLVENRGWIHHLFSQEVNVRDFGSFMETLRTGLVQKLGLDAPDIQPRDLKGGLYLRSLLQLAGEAAVHRGQRQVIVIDGLDEAAPTPRGSFPLFLPPALPPGIQVVVLHRAHTCQGFRPAHPQDEVRIDAESEYNHR